MSGLFSANTVAHFSTARVAASCGQAVAGCADKPAPKRRTRPLIPNRFRIFPPPFFFDRPPKMYQVVFACPDRRDACHRVREFSQQP